MLIGVMIGGMLTGNSYLFTMNRCHFSITLFQSKASLLSLKPPKEEIDNINIKTRPDISST